jgi:RNA polymerase sigma-70 factor (ECF subfamily)
VDPIAPDDTEVERLLGQVRDGDRSALDQLLSHFRGYLRRVVELRMDQKLRTRLDPSDVVQEAQLEVAQRIEDYLQRQPMPFPLWLRQTAQQHLLRLRRQHVEAECRAVERELPLPDDSSALLAQDVLTQAQTPGQQAHDLDLARRTRRAVALLPEDEREVILMRNFEGLSNREVSQILEIDPSTTSKRYGRALLLLRRFLKDDGLTGSDA